MRVWQWNVDHEDYETDPESPNFGGWVRTHYFAIAGAPRFPGDPTDLTQLTCVETVDGLGTFAMGAVPYADQAALVTAYNETVIERLHLEPEPTG